MCVILDTNLAGEVFKEAPNPVAAQFFDWMNTAACRLVVGGELRRELERVNAYLHWSRVALRAGRLRQEDDAVVDERTRELERSNICKSDDAHVIALAQVSGARMLYSADDELGRDFRDSTLLNPPGKLLPLNESRNARQQRRRLLTDRDLCPAFRITP